jgi:hypothetical protein
MPRNASSTYSLPAGNPVVPGTIIATTWANTTLTDIATALTQSLSTDGSTASVSLANKTMTGATFAGLVVTGQLTLPNGQIVFPAVANPASNPNTLDDYEEGTWSPALTFATPGNLAVAYSTLTATYTKIGDTVTFAIRIATSTFNWTTSTGSALIINFPFTAVLVTGHIFSMVAGYTSGITSGIPSGWFAGTMNSNTNFVTLVGTDTTGGTPSVLGTSNFPTGVQKEIVLSGSYKTPT